MKVPDVIEYRKLKNIEVLEKWLTAVARELVFSAKISGSLVLLTLVLKSLTRFLLIFLIFQNDPQTTPGTLTTSICRNDYSAFCLLATNLTVKVYAAWILLSPALSGLLIAGFWGYLAGAWVFARADPNIRQESGFIAKLFTQGARVFVAICLIFGVLGFSMSWVFVFTHSHSGYSGLVSQDYQTAGFWLGIILTTSSILVNIFLAQLRFSWRRFHLPIAEKLIGSSDILECVGDGFLLFGQNFIFSSHLALGFFAGLLFCLYWFRAKSEFPVTWKETPLIDLANIGLMLLEAALMAYLTCLRLVQASFALPTPLLASVLFAVLTPMMSRCFLNLVPFLAKKERSLQDRIWSSMIRPEDLRSLMLLSAFLQTIPSSNSLMHGPKDAKGVDLMVRCAIQRHTQDCQVISCVCHKNLLNRRVGFRNSEQLLRVLVAEGFRKMIAENSGRSMQRPELQVIIGYLDFVPRSYEAILAADLLHHHDSKIIQRIHWKLAFYACKLRRDKKILTADSNDLGSCLDFCGMIQRESRLLQLGALMRAYFTEFLTLQRVASRVKVPLILAKESLSRLFAIELEYTRTFDQLQNNEEIQRFDLVFRLFFRLPRKRPVGGANGNLHSRLAFIRRMSQTAAGREADFQFLLLGVDERLSLHTLRASLGIEEVLGFDKQLLSNHSIDFMIPFHLRKPHARVVEEFLETGNEQLLSHSPCSFLTKEKDDLFPVNLRIQIFMDWMGVKLLVFARIRPNTKLKASIICDSFGTSLHVTKRLGQAIGWPEPLDDYQVPFYLFLENGAEKFIDFVTSKSLDFPSSQRTDHSLEKSLGNFSDRLIVDPNLVAKMRHILRRQRPAVLEDSPLPEDIVESVLAHKFKFVRDHAGISYSYPSRFILRECVLGPTSFLFVGLPENFSMETRVLEVQRANLLFRMVLLRIFLRLGVKSVLPQRLAAIRKLFTALIARRHLSLHARRSVRPSEHPGPLDINGEKARIASKFYNYNKHEPMFFKWLKLGLVCVGCALLALTLVAIFNFRNESTFVAEKVTINFETAYMITPLQYLSGSKLLQLCNTPNCTLAAQAIQKAAVDWAKGRSKVLGNSATLFARRDYLDIPSDLRPGFNSAEVNFYSILTETLNAIMYKNSSAVNATELIYNNVQTMWRNFQPRLLTPGLEGLLEAAMDKFTLVTYIIGGIGFILLVLVGVGYCFLRVKINFLLSTIQFFDLQHFAEVHLENFAKSTSLIEFHADKSSQGDLDSPFSEIRKFALPSLRDLFPVVRIFGVLSALLCGLLGTTYSIIRYQNFNTLAPFVVRTVIARAIFFFMIRGHQILFPASAIQIDDQSWANAINNMTQIAYFGQETYPLNNRTKVLDILSSACPPSSAKNYPDCSRYFQGVLAQNFQTINSFLINHVKRQSGSFPLTDPQNLDLALAFTISGVYLRDLTAAVQSIGAEQLAGLSANVLNTIWIVMGVGVALSLIIFLAFLKPLTTDLRATRGIIYFLDPIRAFSNSQIRFFLDELS